MEYGLKAENRKAQHFFTGSLPPKQYRAHAFNDHIRSAVSCSTVLFVSSPCSAITVMSLKPDPQSTKILCRFEGSKCSAA